MSTWNRVRLIEALSLTCALQQSLGRLVDYSDIPWISATDLVELTKKGDVRPTEIAEAMISQVEAVNPTINALVHFDPEQIMRDAKKLEKSASRGSLFGVPFTIKNLTNVAGLVNTEGGFVSLRNNMIDRDAVLVERMRDAGGLFLGLTNSPPFGYCARTRNELFGETHNPWRVGSTPGGSSGGAGAAVAAGLGQMAEGSDGGGSVRIPAALNGVVGMKPTLGVVPQTLVPDRFVTYCYHGPLTRTVADNALMLDVVSGFSPRDPMSVHLPERSYVDAVGAPLPQIKIAWSEDLGISKVDPEVAQIAREALGCLEDVGAVISNSRPDWSDVLQSMWVGVWLPATIGIKDVLVAEREVAKVDIELEQLIDEALALTPAQISSARDNIGRMWDTLVDFMSDFDIIACPTVGYPTFPNEQFAPDELLQSSLADQLLGWFATYPFNMLTNPSISVPAGFTKDGLPVGLQLSAMRFREDLLYSAASAIEGSRPWADKRPSLT